LTQNSSKHCYIPIVYQSGFEAPNYIPYCLISYSSMSNSETQPKDEEEKNNRDDAVLAQIGEDPGLPADAIEQDSKSMAHKENKQGKATDLGKTKNKKTISHPK